MPYFFFDMFIDMTHEIGLVGMITDRKVEQTQGNRVKLMVRPIMCGRSQPIIMEKGDFIEATNRWPGINTKVYVRFRRNGEIGKFILEELDEQLGDEMTGLKDTVKHLKIIASTERRRAEKLRTREREEMQKDIEARRPKKKTDKKGNTMVGDDEYE